MMLIGTPKVVKMIDIRHISLLGRTVEAIHMVKALKHPPEQLVN